MDIKAGDLIRFNYINGHTPHLNDNYGLYLGEAFIHRKDGVVVENHRVWMVGEAKPTIIDRGLLRHMLRYDPNKDNKYFSS